MEQPWHRGWFDRSAGRMALPHMGQWRSWFTLWEGEKWEQVDPHLAI